MRILVVEDERQLASIIRRGLLEQGYVVDNAFDGEEAEYMAASLPYDLILLDIMLPKKDGFAVCQALRARKVETPILMLTAKDSVDDRVQGLDFGADDYQVKPFAFKELLARIRALLRRETGLKSTRLEAGGLALDTTTREVTCDGRPVEFTAKEYAILEYFLRHPGMVVTRTMLEEGIWDLEFDGISNIIDVYIRRIRRKIDKDGQPSLIQTVRNAGYRLRAP